MSQRLQKKILFVDDDETFLIMVERMMQHYSSGHWEILTAPNASRGLSLLQQHKIDLVAIDLHMPVVDGLQFLALLHRKYPNIVKVMLTGDTSTQQRAAALGSGAELYLEKPATREGWKNVYETLNELTTLQQEQGFHGVLRQVGLPDVLQLSCLSRQSVILRVRTGGMEGSIYVKDGDIIHAQCGDKVGEAAFSHMMGLAGGEFDLQPFVRPPEQTITQSWEFLVMEAARKRDELRSAAPAGQTDMLLKPLEEPVPNSTSHFGQAEPLQMVEEANVELHPRVDEVLVCTFNGDVLHEWQCPSTAGRLSFIQFLLQKSFQLRNTLPLGEFDRLEVNGPVARVVAQFQTDRMVLVRTSRVPANQIAASR